MIPPHTFHSPWLTALALVTVVFQLHGSPLTGRRFISFDRFDQFEVETSAHDGGGRLTSPIIEAGFDFDQIVVSWNIALAPGALLRIDAQPIFDGRNGSFYTLGYWSGRDAHAHPRRRPISRSGDKQSNPDGEVQTDVLVLSRPAQSFRVRLSVVHASNQDPTVLQFVGVSLLNSSVAPPEMAATPEPGRGRILAVPTRSQLDYPGGGAWCSPTSVSMVLSYWSGRLERPDLNRDVPEVA
ncbi:MAG: C39 family peptidase, partial [Verrucomicrobia bacterium]|nr:C39 family peptidase [Verrucomicrobiota bacterium]